MRFGSLFSENAIDRYRPAWMLIELAILLIGVFTWIADGFGVDSFSPATWGEFAVQYDVRVWAAIQIGAATLIISGLMRPVTRRRVAFGASVQAIQFGAIAYSAMFTGGQFVIGVWPTLFIVPFHCVLFWEAVKYEPD